MRIGSDYGFVISKEFGSAQIDLSGLSSFTCYAVVYNTNEAYTGYRDDLYAIISLATKGNSTNFKALFDSYYTDYTGAGMGEWSAARSTLSYPPTSLGVYQRKLSLQYDISQSETINNVTTKEKTVVYVVSYDNTSKEVTFYCGLLNVRSKVINPKDANGNAATLNVFTVGYSRFPARVSTGNVSPGFYLYYVGVVAGVESKTTVKANIRNLNSLFNGKNP